MAPTVANRCTQPSVLKTDANHEKLIHACSTPYIENRNAPQAAPTYPASMCANWSSACLIAMTNTTS